MNAPTTAAAVARPDDYQGEARRLIEWAFANAAYYKKNAPVLIDDIQGFEDIAALLDTFRAGLILVPPHPAMQAELVRWVSVSTDLPQDGELVLLWSDGDEYPWMGYLDGPEWRSAEGFPVPMTSNLFWASMPTGPALAQPVEAVETRHEEAA